MIILLSPWAVHITGSWLHMQLDWFRFRGLGAQGGGGGRVLYFFHIRTLGPSIYRSPKKNIRNFKHPKKIFEILATPKNIQFLYLDLKKDPKLHRNDPQTSPILWWPQKNIHKILIPPKNIIFSENPRKYWNSEFWTQKNGLSLRMRENIGVPPPPPPPPWV